MLAGLLQVKRIHLGQAATMEKKIEEAEATIDRLSEIASVMTLRANDPLMEPAEDPVEALGR
jgi:hypothetical protein